MSGFDDDRKNERLRDHPFVGAALVGAGIAIGLMLAIAALKML